MKKRKFNKKLALNKNTVANLDNREMNGLLAGMDKPIEPVPETIRFCLSVTCISVCDSALSGDPFCVCPTC